MDTSLTCMNIEAGYYYYHTPYEYCILEHMENGATLGNFLIEQLGKNEYVIPFYKRTDDIHTDDYKFFHEKFQKKTIYVLKYVI